LLSTGKLHKRLGGLRLKEITEQIKAGDFASAASALLEYYDKTYLHGLDQRPLEKITTLSCSNANPAENAARIKQHLEALSG
ncbi:hypothetical protein ACFLRI_05665, partial [Bacteroidota bacterium]